jgi:hypothetical protein
MVVNLNDLPLENATYSDLSKGLHYAVAPAVMHIEKVPSSVDEAISSLPEKVAEEI